MLALDQLTVDIQNSRILRGISMQVAAGQLVCLIGRNGAGKTTTFRTIMGYLTPVVGTVVLNDTSIVGLPTHKIAQLGIGYAPEESQVFGDLNVAENIELPTWTRPQGATRRPASQWRTKFFRSCATTPRAVAASFPAASARWCRLPAR